ncbi:BTB domain-containing protein [Mycena chlorophos]|uniref:BTB domain-containing protein n=1 Tax=Mycena chlorophos TaxID=658473 RepID=A0A8H6VVM4_MYCCL|nr:BTB domain-containing protein [Mycena chlorophos]
MQGEETLKRVDGLWFDADAVVLRADDTVFRVSRSILAARSTVFRDMVAFPQPAAGTPDVETIDGIPVVRMFDSPEDVEPFLRAIFDSRLVPNLKHFNFLAVLSILRLSHKYGVEYLFQRALIHLEHVYPVDPSPHRPLHTLATNHLGYEAGKVDLDLRAIPLLRQVEATWLLPFAFYSLGTYYFEEVFPSAFWATFPEDLQRIFLCLQMKHIRMIGTMHHCVGDASTSPNCRSEDQCSSEIADFCRTSILFHSPLNDLEERVDLDPLIMWDRSLAWDTFIENRICESCRLEILAEKEDVWWDLWEQLPANCGLEKWDVLKQRRQVVLGP